MVRIIALDVRSQSINIYKLISAISEQPMQAILTIAIPTYNRCVQLNQLLDSIFHQLESIRQMVRIIVIDNHSIDQTQQCCEKWLLRMTGMSYIRNPENIGMARNIIKCFETADTQYCWVFGDDDMIRIGVLPQIVRHLVDKKPDLFYCGYVGFRDIPEPAKAVFPKQLTTWQMSARPFCRITHINITFLSAVITNKAAFIARGGLNKLRQFENTVLPQLAWLFDTLTHGKEFSFVQQELVLSRLEGSGGFDIYKTFTVDVVSIVDQGLLSPMKQQFKRRTVIKFLPSLIYTIRQNKRGNFIVLKEQERYFRDAYSKFICYWLLLMPILKLPLPMVTPVFYASRLVSKYLSVIDRVWLVLFNR